MSSDSLWIILVGCTTHGPQRTYSFRCTLRGSVLARLFLPFGRGHSRSWCQKEYAGAGSQTTHDATASDKILTKM